MSQNAKQPYDEVLQVAQQIVEKLSPYCERIEIAGSLRRERAMIGDIEIVALQKVHVWQEKDLFGNGSGKEHKTYQLHDFLVNKVSLEKGVKPDAKYKVFQYGKYKVDLFLPESKNHWGSVFTIRTGSHDFNMWIMDVRCAEVGITFKEGRIYKGTDLLKTPDEIDIFQALKMDFVPPTKRDDGKWESYKNKVNNRR